MNNYLLIINFHFVMLFMVYLSVYQIGPLFPNDQKERIESQELSLFQLVQSGEDEFWVDLIPTCTACQSGNGAYNDQPSLRENFTNYKDKTLEGQKFHLQIGVSKHVPSVLAFRSRSCRCP